MGNRSLKKYLYDVQQSIISARRQRGTRSFEHEFTAMQLDISNGVIIEIKLYGISILFLQV